MSKRDFYDAFESPMSDKVREKLSKLIPGKVMSEHDIQRLWAESTHQMESHLENTFEISRLIDYISVLERIAQAHLSVIRESERPSQFSVNVN